MSILCCCHHRQPAGKDTQTEAIELPMQPPRATLSKALSRSDTDMYLSSILDSRAPSQLITPTYQNIVDPDAVDVEDSDDDAPKGDKRKSNMSSLGVLGTKLIRRLSHRVDVKACSQPSGGASDEELARRAELRRLMHKRIQAELKSEEEEDAGDGLGLASAEQPSIVNYKEPELPGGGPRDGIEFTVSGIDEKDNQNGAGASPETLLLPTPVADESQGLWRKRNSRSGNAKGSIDGSCPEYISLDEMESINRHSSPSRLASVHLLGEDGRKSPSTASWRGSYCAAHIESYIEPIVEVNQTLSPRSPDRKDTLAQEEDCATRPLEADTTNSVHRALQDGGIDKTQAENSEQEGGAKGNHLENYDSCSLSDEASNGRYSPLDIWLWSQELHSSSVLSTCSKSEMVPGHPNKSDVWEQAKESLQYNESAKTTADSSISQEHDVSVWHRSSEIRVTEDRPSINAPSSESNISNKILIQIENVAPSAEWAPMQDQRHDVSSRYTSSRYTTRSQSQQATPGGSRPKSSELPGSCGFVQTLNPVHRTFSSYHTTASQQSGTSSYRTAPNKAPSSDTHQKAKLEASQLPMAEVRSINASETASFRQREEELKSVKKRFGLTPSHRYPMTPVRSKFREEFDELKGSSTARSSILSKLYLAFPKTSRASRSHTGSIKNTGGVEVLSPVSQRLGSPHSSRLGSYRNRSLTPNVVPGSQPEEKAAGLWQRAMKPGASNSTGRWKVKPVKASIYKTDLNTGGNRPADSGPLQAREERDAPVEYTFPPAQRVNDMLKMNEGLVHGSCDIPSGVLQEWVEQLQAEDVQRCSRTESRNDGPKPQPSRLRTPPGSWAKWPSHTRNERTAAASEGDRVATRDFATATNSTPLATDVEDDRTSKGSEPNAPSRTLPTQVGKALKSGWNKMVTHKISFGRDLGHVSAAQDTQTLQGFMEYPELKLLPTAECYREVQALEQQIGSMKRRSTSTRYAARLSSSDSTKSPLANRIAEEVCKIQSEGESVALDNVEPRAKSPLSKQPPTPPHALFAPHSKSQSVGSASTAAPRCTYEECVQTHMLDDDDEDCTFEWQDTTIKRARSTGNINFESTGVGRSVVKDIHEAPVHKTWRSGLRRHKSLSFLTRVHDSIQDRVSDSIPRHRKKT
ncbi:hypothetical protein GGR50DRAFT_639271 [Xylaria sp. CBS 124048]|nr:hypothetical protein GGR50DRAFT_639271 [Xylaria sp. CBS 124048]